MNKFLLLIVMFLCSVVAAMAEDVVRTANGLVDGRGGQPSGVRIFRGIPFAQPPTGELRWREPQPVKNWTGVRPAFDFGPRCMQAVVFDDIRYRSNGVSEDCLYLNVWTPAKSNQERLPVLVYFYGGGFVNGDSSEPRYDGESMAAKGIVVVSVNYRLGVFGFLALPELTKESPHKASGNYGLLDQNAGLRWVRQNIANFGGDAKRVTIAGESAGSISVSAHMVSPLSIDLIAGAIGESGAITGALSAVPLAQAEADGSKFVASLGVESLAALRAMPAQQILEPAYKGGYASVGRFPITIDGYFLPADPATIYASGKQARVPLLAGWNSEESGWKALFDSDEPTPENYKKVLAKLFGPGADEALKLYPASTQDEVVQAATDLASDRFIAYSTWKWMDAHGRTGGSPVYYYYYSHPRPAMTAAMGNAVPGLAGGVTTAPNNNVSRPPPPRGAVHSAEIEYAMGNLETNKVFEWTPDDFTVSQKMQGYFANFIKTGNPNGSGLPEWQAANGGAVVKRMRLDVEPRLETETRAKRYEVLDKVYAK